MIDDVELYGVAFMSLYHRDGRFVRSGGVFAFSRRDLDGGRTILHLEPVPDISRHADSSHPRWDGGCQRHERIARASGGVATNTW
ncbi:hypothetical protein [Caulobacter sp. DWR1-3-2b1]|uniref:hypothetical protein n=1 Tax=Caulobacter sp. DWR1-3-2b1 TaxID=2804670 RepID=UPI003CE6EF6B